MQHVGEPGTPEMKSEDKPSGGLSPVKAFFALLALLVAIGGLFLLTRPTNESNPGAAPRSDNFALTDAEAIERFKELDARVLSAYEAGDPSLLSGTFTPTSPMKSTAAKELRTLKREGVHSESRFDTRSLSVVSNGESTIQIRQIVVVHPKFVTESGKDVTRNGEVERQTVDWTLHRIESEWLLHRSLIVDAEPHGQ
jgi:hypothetical protein